MMPAVVSSQSVRWLSRATRARVFIFRALVPAPAPAPAPAPTCRWLVVSTASLGSRAAHQARSWRLRAATAATAAVAAAAAAAATGNTILSPSGFLLVPCALGALPFASTIVHAEAAAPTYTTESFGLPGSVVEDDDGASLIARAYLALKLAARATYLSALGISVLLPGIVVRTLDRYGLSPRCVTDLWWAWAVQALEIAGPTFIKLAQWAASRPDMFPDTFCEHFGVLHDATTPHAWGHTATLLDGALGPEWEKRLVLNPEVIGSGCIAQVYSGVWYATREESESGKGTKVAIKVSHPNIHSKVNADMKILKYIARQVEYWVPEMQWMGGLDVVTDFEALMHRQMDLRVEARNLTRFRENFAAESDLSVDFPRPIFTTESVLIETFAEGRPINEFIYGEYSPEVKKIIADAGVQISLRMVFKHNFIHADLHPGNILIDWDGDKDSTPHIICLDAGLAYQVTKHTTFLNIVGALMMRKGEEAGLHMLENSGQSSVFGEEQVAAYCNGIQAIVDEARNHMFFEHLGTYISLFFRLAYTHQVKLDHNFVCVAMAIKVMEGLAIALNPSLDLIHAALPYVAESKVTESTKGLREAVSFQMGFSSRGEVVEESKTWGQRALDEADKMEQRRLADQAKELSGWEQK